VFEREREKEGRDIEKEQNTCAIRILIAIPKTPSHGTHMNESWHILICDGMNEPKRAAHTFLFCSQYHTALFRKRVPYTTRLFSAKESRKSPFGKRSETCVLQ